MKLLYELTWNNRYLTLEATTLPEMAKALEEAAAELRAMDQAGWNWLPTAWRTTTPS